MKTLARIFFFIVFVSGSVGSGMTGTALNAQSLHMERMTPLRNPDRGFHVESNFFVHNYHNPFNDSLVFPDSFIDDRVEAFGAQGDSITLTQLYLYLSDYVDGDIPEEALDRMQVIFDTMKSKGCKAILRFAYNYKGIGFTGGETRELLSRHLDQLEPFIHKNQGLIATCQMGFIGAWGEWHSSPLSKDQEAKDMLVNRLLEIFPEEYCLELRYPAQKRLLTLDNPEDWKRIGFSNDYFTAGEHPLAPENDFVPGDGNYAMVFRDSPWFFMSGEIPYAENTEWGLHKLISVDRTLQIMRDHHYSAFDISQNNELNIRHWKECPLTAEKLDTLGILYDESYFRNSSGQQVARSAYDFIRDHLGYRLNLKSADIERKGRKIRYSISFTNTGFATVINPHQVHLLLIDPEGDIAEDCLLSGADPKSWQPYDPESGTHEVLTHSIEGIVRAAGLGKGGYKVGIWMPDAQENMHGNAAYDIKWAGLPIQYIDGMAINIIGEIH